MATFTETKVILDEIAIRSETNRKRLETAKAQVNAADTDLLAMQSNYSAFAAQLDIDASANPTDPAWQAALAEKDQMQSDFVDLKNRAASMKTAIDPI